MRSIGEANHPADQRRRDGVVLVITLVCLSVATAIIVTTTRQAVDARRQSRMDKQLRQTQYLLDAGIQRAVAATRSRTDYRGETWQPTRALPGFRTVEVQITVSPQQDHAAGRVVTVVARLGQGESLASHTKRSHTFPY